MKFVANCQPVCKLTSQSKPRTQVVYVEKPYEMLTWQKDETRSADPLIRNPISVTAEWETSLWCKYFKEHSSILHLYKSTTFLLSVYIIQFSSLPWHNFFYCFVFCFSSVNEPATDGTTPVYLAAQDGNLECLKYLHSVGGKCDARARDGMLPVHGAAQNGHLECIAYLVCWF